MNNITFVYNIISANCNVWYSFPAKATNEVIQDNVDKLFEDLRPVIEKVITSLIEDLIFRVLANNVPYDKLYPK